MEHIWTILMLKILHAHLLRTFVANSKIDAIYALYPESFCDKNLAVRKVFAFSDSAQLYVSLVWDLFCCIVPVIKILLLLCSGSKCIIRTLELLQCHRGQKMMVVKHQGFMQQCLNCNKPTFFYLWSKVRKCAMISIILAWFLCSSQLNPEKQKGGVVTAKLTKTYRSV